MTRSPSSQSLSAWPGAIPISSSYSAGSAGQIFFETLKQQGKLIASPCQPCKQVYLPPRAFCERCFAALTEQVEIKPAGRLVSYTICYIDHDRKRLRRPQALALVQLDGTTTTLLHYLLTVTKPDQVTIGDRVELVIKAKPRRRGSMLDMEGFRLTKK